MKDDKNRYTLIHYDTEILRVYNGKIIKCKPVTKSTNRILKQALHYLKTKEQNINQISLRLNGKSVTDMMQEFKPYKVVTT